MREIKFRAWNLDYKWMEDNFHINSSGVVYGEPARHYGTPNTEIEENPNLVIMQFTGLTDKNGVEIYEGDICCSPHFTCNLLVDYDDTLACWFTIDVGDYMEPLNEMVNNIEVIGNIHQNPDLLPCKQQ